MGSGSFPSARGDVGQAISGADGLLRRRNMLATVRSVAARFRARSPGERLPQLLDMPAALSHPQERERHDRAERTC